MVRRCLLSTSVAILFAIVLVGAVRADSSCVYSFSKGKANDHISWCVSTGGNIVRFKSPEFSDHIGTAGAFAEGLIVCQFPGGRVAADDGVDQAGWSGGGPILVSTSPLVIDRVAMNPATGTTPLLSVRQKFTTDYAEKELIVEITVTNISGVTQNQLSIARVSDLNVESRIDNFWHNTPGGNWAAGFGSGVVMGAIPKGFGTEAFVSSFQAFHSCLPERFGGPAGPVAGDFVGVVNFGIGTLQPGKSKSFKVSYRRY